MTRRRNIFIGCNKKERGLAETAKSILEQDFDVTIWDDPIWESDTPGFKLNDSILQGLLRASLRFDFAVMIGTQDDIVEKKGETVMQARDNVLFELGLFIGRMGLKNCAFIVDSQLNIMADLHGIVIPKFKPEQTDSFEKAARMVRDSFLKIKDWSINYLPSATLASAYYQSLILPTHHNIIHTNGLEIDNIKYSDWKIKIIIPTTVSKNINFQFQHYKNGRDLKEIIIDAPGRTRKLILEAKIQNGIPVIVDFPTILSGINHSIKHLLPAEYHERNEDYTAIIERELERFKKALLDYAKGEGPDLSNRIVFEDIH